jgi:hypothetical protein
MIGVGINAKALPFAARVYKDLLNNKWRVYYDGDSKSRSWALKTSRVSPSRSSSNL